VVAVIGTEANPGLLINRNFALLWTGHALSVLGDHIFETTLVVWLATELAPDEDWSALAVSGLLVASAVPVFVVGPAAGVFVDRWRDKRRVMVRADAFSALLILALIPAAGIVSLPFLPDGLPLAIRLGAIFTIVFLASAVAQFFRPATAVLLRDIVPEPYRGRAMGLNQAAASFALLAGPPLAAPLLIAFGAGWGLLINAASFVASMLTILAIRSRPSEAVESAPPPADFLREFRDGVRFFRRSRVLVTVAVAAVIVVIGGGALNALDVFFVTENLGASAESYGLLGAAQGAGMLAGSVLAAALATRIAPARMLWASLATMGLLILAYSRLTSLAPAVALVLLIGLVNPAINVAVGPIVFQATPREYLGRVMATINPVINAASILGVLLAGLLYSTVLQDFQVELFGVAFGPLDTIFAGAGIGCLLGAAYARANLNPNPSPRR
jgi:MFS family permease